MQSNSTLKTLQAQVEGMDCPNCAQTIQSHLDGATGIRQATVSFSNSKLEVSYNSEETTETEIRQRVEALGYRFQTAATTPAAASTKSYSVWQFWLSTRRGQELLLAGLGFLLGGWAQFAGLDAWIWQIFYSISIVTAGWRVARAGGIALKSGKADMNLLMTVSAVGAVILGEWVEGVMVVFLFSLGTSLQSFALGRTRRAIQDLMALTPTTATVRRGEEEVELPIEEIVAGDRLLVRPGQRIALDGTVVSGTSAIDESAITGESVPADKSVGDEIYSGTLNQAGYLEVEVTRTCEDTTLAKIVRLVESAQASRAPAQQWVDKFAAIYTPAVIGTAIAIGIIPPLLFAQPLTDWVYRALVLLVIACPCALVISTPVSIVSAIGAATKAGVLFKGGHGLEMAGQMQALAFDKTGTLTQGSPSVQQVYVLGDTTAEQILSLAASLEQTSEHPFARAILERSQQDNLVLQSPHNVNVLPGLGIAGELDTGQVWVGNHRLLAEYSISLPSEEASWRDAGQTVVFVGTSDRLLGAIALADPLRVEAQEAIHRLQRTGIKRLVMLTGDRWSVAQQIAADVGMKEYRAELLPPDKLTELKELRQQQGTIGMVGDGINDAPALAAADVSFAIGRNDLALETADIVLVGDDLRQLDYAIALSREAVATIRQNIIFSLATKGVFLLLASVGIAGLIAAVVADVGTSLLVTLNGMRLFGVRSR